jgi:MFS family permease
LGLFFTGPGQTFSFSIFIEHFINEFNWTRTEVNAYYSIASLIAGLSMYLVGKVVDKHGAKKVMIIAALLLAFSMLWLSFLNSLWMLFIGFFLGRFSGQSSLALASNTIAPHWFLKKRGHAIMLSGLGATLGNMIYPKLNVYLLNTYGWRMTFQILGAMLFFIFVPLCYIFIVNKPEDVGLHPDGISDEDHDKEHLLQVELDHDTSLTHKDAMKTFAFWILFFSVFQFSMINTGIGLNYISIYNEGGLTDIGFITNMMSLSPLIGIISTLLSSLYIQRVKKPNLLLGILSLVHVAAYIVLSNLNSEIGAIVYTSMIGLTMSIFLLLHNILKPYFFGRQYIGAVSGLLVIAMSAGSAFGPVLFGLSYDLLGGYKQVLILCAAFPLITGIMLVFVRKPKQRRHVKQ